MSELAATLRQSLDEAFPSGVWVAGEINGISRARSGHVYFDLLERPASPAAGKAPLASLSVTLFRSDKERVNQAIKRHGNAIRMDDGVTVRIGGMLDFYAQRGQLQLRMTAIDPAHTLGSIAAQREALLRDLAAAGLLRRNADAVLAAAPLRVGLVTSLGSAAHSDVLRVWAGSGYAFEVLEADTPVQGPEAPESIAAAIAAVSDRVDVVVLARGGGSRSDLAAFDHPLVAHAVAGCRRPVFTGIGHETDRSAADETAHTSCSTPTAAAEAVTQRVEEWLLRLDAAGKSIIARGRQSLLGAQHRCDSIAAAAALAARTASGGAERRLTAVVQRAVSQSKASALRAEDRLEGAARRLLAAQPRIERQAVVRLDTASARLATTCRHEIRHARRRLDAIAQRMRSLDPEVILRRGWSLTRRDDGTLLRSVSEVGSGDSIVTHLADGTITSTIESDEQT
ncbi:MAG: exodeoxyribonuclease VII large subunit [Acidimicrobiaceae bacterium]|nr:exodeoxyribonuclease VII large subunit [Acidimicrobiaceae bacterium]MCY4176288.1 exodeoxyribonuclease VII large subunit [Acidimicrobiaceae bacterium]MCY4280267.1 exodeoxyribonuclease VII large subunit [Acidimicrobiaceae bacterium]MCY4293552.1 exodeoxyribonuclease VII large subunit [Acidimicrobiaceae bacterium]